MIAGCASATATACGCGRIALHADDLGMSRAVTEGILRGFRDGPLTSTSLLANAPDAGRALGRWTELLRQQRSGSLPSWPLRHKLDDNDRPFDLGIHLNLTEGCPLTAGRYPPELLDAEGHFPGIRALFRRIGPRGGRFHAALLDELSSQVRFMLDHGIQPMHLNGHQYVELLPTVRDVVAELLETFHIRVVRAAAEPSLWPMVFGRGLRPSAVVFAAAQQYFARQFRRRMDRLAVGHADRFFGTALAGRIEMRRMREFLGNTSENGNGVNALNGLNGLKRPSFRLTEICLHPAEEDGTVPVDGWNDPLAASRPQELQMLVSTELAEYLVARGAQLGRLSELANP